MKILVLAKRGSVVHWAEDAMAAFQAAGHETRHAVTRDPRLNRTLEKLLTAPTLGVPRAVAIARMIRRFSPDLILAIGPYGMPAAILESVAAIPDRAPLIGWVGDVFTPEEARAADWLDLVGYTDTGLLARHHELHLPCRAGYVPHAANPRLVLPADVPAERDSRMVFVANPTAGRAALVRQIREPVALYGPGWGGELPSQHAIHARFVGVPELAQLYASHLAALNIRHEHNVLLGLNQRHFDPCLAATPVVTDDQPDLHHCFEPGREALVYRDAEDLNDVYARLRREPALAAAIGERARRRVMAEHSYAHRLDQLTRL